MITRHEAREQITLLTARIERMQHLLSCDFHNITINFFTGSQFPRQYNVIDNSVIPFSLEGELRLLLTDSIEELKRQRDSFMAYLN